MSKKRRVKSIISCNQCKSQSDCCKFGAWADLEEAKRITAMGLKGEFFQLEKDKDFPSGYKIGTSYEDESCSFLDPDGLCSIHKVDYYLKPKSCRDFPYEDNEISDFAEVLCTPFIAKARKRKKRRLYKNV